MGKLSRTKGANFERYGARTLNALKLESADFRRELRETQQGNIGDVKDVNGIWPLDIQMKHRKVVDVRGAVREAELASRIQGAMREAGLASKTLTGSDGPRIPIAWLRWHGGEEVMAMRPQTFFTLLAVLDDYVYEHRRNRTDAGLMAILNEASRRVQNALS